MYVRIMKGDMHSKWGLLTNEELPSSEPADPLEQTMNEIIDTMFTDEAEEERETNEEPNETNEEPSGTTDESMTGEGQTNDATRETATQTEATPRFSTSPVERAKLMLLELLKQDGYSDKSSEVILSRFNWFLDTEKPFPLQRTEDQIGFSWKQIGMAFPDFKPIANIALKLLNSSCSEASCERTISAQRLIHTSRRRNANRQTLDARLTIMNCGRKNGIHS